MIVPVYAQTIYFFLFHVQRNANKVVFIVKRYAVLKFCHHVFLCFSCFLRQLKMKQYAKVEGVGHTVSPPPLRRYQYLNGGFIFLIKCNCVHKQDMFTQ